jgi:hypothetical protein
MIAEIQAGYAGTKAALDIAKGIFALKTEVERNQAVIDIQRNVIEAQNALSAAEREYSASLKRIDALEQEIVRLKDWSGEMERYEARDVYRGAIAYVMKVGMENGQEPHYLCANCFINSRKSFLQLKGIHGNEAKYGCDACQGSIAIHFRAHPKALAENDAQARART